MTIRINSKPFPKDVWWSFAVVLAVGLVWFLGLEHRSLFNPDEGRYAEIPREMLASGDWVTPRLNGLKYFEKPPLQYWLTASAYALFGEHAWTSRLWTALAGFLGILLTAFLGYALWGVRTGFFAAAVLASSLMYVLGGHINTLDMGLTFWVNLALAGFALAGHPGRSSKQRLWWAHLMWAALALGVLSKGVIAIALPALTLGVYSVLTRDWSWRGRLAPTTGVPLFLLLAAPWFVAVSLANPEFPYFFFWHEHVERFVASAHGRDKPWWFFAVMLALGLIPWIGLLPSALQRAWFERGFDGASQWRPGRFLVIWVGTVVVFLSASHSKLPFYILPAFPAIALLIGRWLDGANPARVALKFWPAAVAGGALLLAATYLERLWPDIDALQAMLWSDSVVFAGVLCIAAFVGTVWLARVKRLSVITLSAGAAGLLSWQAMLYDAEDLAPTFSGIAMAQATRPYLLPETRVFSVDMYDQTFPFYLRRDVTLVRYRGELEFGLAREPQLGLPDDASFQREWEARRGDLAIMPVQTYERLIAQGIGMRVITRQGRTVLVTQR